MSPCFLPVNPEYQIMISHIQAMLIQLINKRTAFYNLLVKYTFSIQGTHKCNPNISMCCGACIRNKVHFASQGLEESGILFLCRLLYYASYVFKLAFKNVR